MNNAKLIAEIKKIQIDGFEWDREARDLVDIKQSPTVFERDGLVIVSAEDGRGFADYYHVEFDSMGNEFDAGPYIHPVLEKFASDRGFFWEWENPGCIVLYPA